MYLCANFISSVQTGSNFKNRGSFGPFGVSPGRPLETGGGMSVPTGDPGGREGGGVLGRDKLTGITC